MTFVIPKQKRPKPETIETLPRYTKLTPYMISRNATTILYALAKSPYSRNGRYEVVTLDAQANTARDGIYFLALNSGENGSVYFKNFCCTRYKTCPVQARIPVNAQTGEVPAILFGQHKHQLFENSVYNLETGLSFALEELLQTVLDLSRLLNIEPKDLFCHHYTEFDSEENDDEINELLYEFSLYQDLYSIFKQSEFYETGTSTAYLYVHKDVNPTSPLMEKVFGVRYAGRRTGSLSARLIEIRKSVKECAKLLNACGSLEFLTVEATSKVSAKTASVFEQLLLSNFVAKSNERPFQQLINSVLITGDDYQVFEDSENEQMLAAYIFLNALIKDDSRKRELDENVFIEPKRWFPVNLNPKLTTSPNSPVGQAMLYVIRHCAQILKAGDDWRDFTIDAAQDRIEELEEEVDYLHGLFDR
ncbi:hypothetical protein M3Y97_00005000 [Aphelenchoides bicaudatus]|nr:hypothetical protein M3Y97_00005000 [Aphelenchoides bicaudatus]